MNKVINIQLAGQVFCCDEEAYGLLNQYLHQLKNQLNNNSESEDIVQDIELRLAELFFEIQGSSKEHLNKGTVEKVIAQIGYLDSDDIEAETELETKKISYRNHEERIIGGVCAGLAKRFQVPSLIVRLLFLALSALLGIGIVLYLIFWIFLPSPKNRRDLLASEGKAQTARQIADIDMNTNTQRQYNYQNILFLPFTIIGTLIDMLFSHLQKRKLFYFFLLKTALCLVVIFLSVLCLIGLYELNQEQLMPLILQGIATLAVVYLLLSMLTLLISKLFFKSSLITIKRGFKLSLVAPLIIIISSAAYLIFNFSDKQTKTVSKAYIFNEEELNIEFINFGENHYEKYIFYLKNSRKDSNNIIISTRLSARGSNKEDALKNLNTIQYQYELENSTLYLDHDIHLRKGSLYRDQDITVVTEVPDGIAINLNYKLYYDIYDDTYYHRPWEGNKTLHRYIFLDGYLHELHTKFADKLTGIEKDILINRFTSLFFLYGNNWEIINGYKESVYNYYFDQAFIEEKEHIDKIRGLLQENRSIYKIDLLKIREILNPFKAKYADVEKFDGFIQRLIDIKNQYQTYL